MFLLTNGPEMVYIVSATTISSVVDASRRLNSDPGRGEICIMANSLEILIPVFNGGETVARTKVESCIQHIGEFQMRKTMYRLECLPEFLKCVCNFHMDKNKWEFLYSETGRTLGPLPRGCVALPARVLQDGQLPLAPPLASATATPTGTTRPPRPRPVATPARSLRLPDRVDSSVASDPCVPDMATAIVDHTQCNRDDFIGKLVSLTSSTRETIHDHKQELKKVRQHNYNLTRQLARKDDIIQQLQEKDKSRRLSDSSLVIHRGKTNERLTPKSMIALGVRRNFTTIATADVGALLLERISRQTVVRGERKAGDALLHHCQMFFKYNVYPLLDRSLSDIGILDRWGADLPPVTSCAIYAYTSDATNSCIWQRRSLSTLQLEIMLCNFFAEPLTDGNWQHVGKVVADLLPTDYKTGLGTVALTLKHLGSLGCPDFLKRALSLKRAGPLLRGEVHPSSCRHLDIICSTQGRGGDQ